MRRSPGGGPGRLSGAGDVPRFPAPRRRTFAMFAVGWGANQFSGFPDIPAFPSVPAGTDVATVKAEVKVGGLAASAGRGRVP